jgi:hypothetical protein
MRVIDLLREEVSAKQQRVLVEETAEHALELRYQQFVLPKMQTILGYLQELIAHVEFLKKSIVVNDYSDRNRQLGRLIQTDYKISTDDFGGQAELQRLMLINLRFNCIGEGECSWEVVGSARIEREIALLSANKVKFNWQPVQSHHKLPTASFTMVKNIPVRFRFEVNYDYSRIKLLIHNHRYLGVYHREFTPQALDDQMLDQIGRYLLCMDEEFLQIEISPKLKSQIQQQIALDKREQAEFFKQSTASNYSPNKLTAQNSFLAQLKNLVS